MESSVSTAVSGGSAFVEVAPFALSQSVAAELQPWLDAFFGGAPWNEGFFCPVCKPATDYSPAHVFPGGRIHAGQCPDCGTTTMPFWSADRVRRYIERSVATPDFHGVVLRHCSKTVGWSWGYRLNQYFTELLFGDRLPVFYVDMLMILPQYRRDRYVEALWEQNAAAIPAWLNASFPAAALGRMTPATRLLIAHLLTGALESGAEGVATRTHVHAHRIRRMLRRTRFREGPPSPQDPNRTFWFRRLAR